MRAAGPTGQSAPGAITPSMRAASARRSSAGSSSTETIARRSAYWNPGAAASRSTAITNRPRARAAASRPSWPAPAPRTSKRSNGLHCHDRTRRCRSRAICDNCSVATILGERVEEIRLDRRHGGSWMARRAVEALVAVADQDGSTGEELLANLLKAGRELAGSRPGVGAVAGAVGRVLAAAERNVQLEPEQLRQLVQEEAAGLIEGRIRAAASIAIQLQERLSEAVVLTHSASATVREALVHTPPERVICTVSSRRTRDASSPTTCARPGSTSSWSRTRTRRPSSSGPRSSSSARTRSFAAARSATRPGRTPWRRRPKPRASPRSSRAR